jgi:hypothetical protein
MPLATIYYCPTHDEWDAGRESGCPRCMRDARVKIDKYEKALQYYSDDSKFGMDSHIDGKVARKALDEEI